MIHTGSVALSSANSCRNIHIYTGYTPTQWTTDAGRLIYKKYIPLTLLQGLDRFAQGLRVRGSWRPKITEIFWPQTYGRQHCVFLVLQGCSTGGSGPTLLGDGFLYCILSASSLDLNSSGPKGPFGLMWLSPTTSRL